MAYCDTRGIGGQSGLTAPWQPSEMPNQVTISPICMNLNLRPELRARLAIGDWLKQPI